jgi:hypothetical protein
MWFPNQSSVARSRWPEPFGKMTSSTQKIFYVARFGAAVVSGLLSLIICFLAQASSPDYRRLLLSILPLVAIDVALIAFVWKTRGRGKIWPVVVLALFALASFLEMASRVLLGFRIL